jgi:hypothetical protein
MFRNNYWGRTPFRSNPVSRIILYSISQQAFNGTKRRETDQTKVVRRPGCRHVTRGLVAFTLHALALLVQARLERW